MTVTLAKQIVSGKVPDVSKDEIRDAWQFLVNDGAIWSDNKKWFPDMAACLVASGVIERNAA